MHQEYIICYQKSFMMLKILALLLPKIVDTDPKKKKIITYHIINTFLAPLRTYKFKKVSNFDFDSRVGEFKI